MFVCLFVCLYPCPVLFCLVLYRLFQTFIFFYFFFNRCCCIFRFTVVEVSFLWPEEGDFLENLHRVVYVIINKRLKKKIFYVFGSFPFTVRVRSPEKQTNKQSSNKQTNADGNLLIRS